MSLIKGFTRQTQSYLALPVCTLWTSWRQYTSKCHSITTTFIHVAAYMRWHATIFNLMKTWHNISSKIQKISKSWHNSYVYIQTWFYVCAQPMREGVILERRPSLAGRKPGISPDIWSVLNLPITVYSENNDNCQRLMFGEDYVLCLHWPDTIMKATSLQTKWRKWTI